MMAISIRRIWVRVCLFTVLLSSITTAQGIALTDKVISNYIRSLQEMESLSDRLTTEDADDGATMARLWLQGDAEAITDYLKSKDYYADVAQAVSKAGFSDTGEWVKVAQRITQAYMALEIGEQGPEVAAQMEESMQQVRNNEQLSQQQKEALLQQLAVSQQQLSQLEEVSAADRAAVEPHMQQLRQHFGAGAQSQ